MNNFMLRSSRRSIFILYLFLIIVQGCAALIEREPAPPAPPLLLITEKDVPSFLDDLDISSLETAIEGSLKYYNRLSGSAFYRINGTAYSVNEFKESLLAFSAIIKSRDTDNIKQKKILEAFDIYKAAGADNAGTVLFTGYYEPILDGSLKRTDKYRYPVYKVPHDLIKIMANSSRNSQDTSEKIIARLEDGQYIPYYSREEIDSFSILHGKNLEIAYLSDPVERYYLHIQGSGKIHLPDGSHIRISYAQSNGRPYRSIGAYLLETNKLTKNELSHQAIKQYLQNHSDELSEILNYNERYIFFRIVDEGAVGSIGVVVTPDRSIATDPKFFPKGALAFMRLMKPMIDLNQGISGRPSCSRFVLNQDEGSAIKGPGRVDLFCGAGKDAEFLAGSLKEKGELYFLLKKKKDRTINEQ